MIELFEDTSISRYARVKQEPDGEWMAAERAVALIRKRQTAGAPPQAPPAVNHKRSTSASRRLWPWGAGGLVGAIVLTGLVARFWHTAPWSAAPVEEARPQASVRKELPPAAPAVEQPAAPSPLTDQPTTSTTAAPVELSNPPVAVASTGVPSAANEGLPADVGLPPSMPYGETSDTSINKPEVTDAGVAEFIASVELERTAAKGNERVDQFIRQHRLSEKQALQIGEVKRRLADRQKRGLVRLGPKWVTPAEQEAAQAEARELIRQAFALTDLGSLEAAEKLLEKASAVDGNNIEADLVLGMLNGIVYLPNAIANAKVAETNFERVLKRSPDHIGALNNAAVVEIRQKHYSQAIDHLTRAAELAPRCPAVTQNLGRLSKLAGEGRVNMPAGDRKRCLDAYSRLIAGGKGTSADLQRGYQLMPPYVPPADRVDQPTDRQLVRVGYGSGFVVAPEMVLTNRHVVSMNDDQKSVADEVRMKVQSSGEAKELNGQVKAVCSTDDLALVHFAGLTAPALPLRTSLAVLAEEAGILGFPRTDQTGDDIKFVSGRVASANKERMFFDCVSNQGNSGGPILSRKGDVIAVLNAVALVGDEVQTQYGRGVPSPAALEFVQAELGSVPPVKPVPGEWPGIVSRVQSSIFKLDVYYQSSNPAILRARLASSGGSDLLEDPSCPSCSGRGAVACPGGCIGGDVEERWIDHTTGTILGRTVVLPQLRKNVRACSVCGGKGAVECPHCVKGIDPALLR